MTDDGRSQVPPGALPPPGWYLDPGDATHTRYWDGQAWTDQVSVLPVPVGGGAVGRRASTSTGGSGLGCVAFIGVALAVVALIIGVMTYLARHPAPGSSGLDEGSATYVCRELVRGRLQTPSSATFSTLHAEPPVAGSQWTVTGKVESRSTQGELVRTGFTCVVEPQGNSGYWRLVRLRFAGS